MKVRVRLFAVLRERLGRPELELELGEGATAGTLIQHFQRQHPHLLGSPQSLMVAVNTEYVGLDHPLKEGDEVALIPPVSGGEVFVQVTEAPLDPQALTQRVQRDTCGAVVTFLGVVRRYSRGRRVLWLEYEAYEEMAEKVLRQVAREALERWPVEEIVLCHRVGKLDIGEVSLVSVVASPHRQEAFDACRYAVDRLKEIAPIWKKEVWEGGGQWVQERP